MNTHVDIFDADGKWYVFNDALGGSECAGPFATQEEAEAAQSRLCKFDIYIDSGFSVLALDEDAAANYGRQAVPYIVNKGWDFDLLVEPVE